MLSAAIGFRVHSGWAALSAVAGSPVSPTVLARRRIEIADRSIPGSIQPFHHAKGLALPEARKYLDRCAAASVALAQIALERAIADLAGSKIVACSIILASGLTTLTLEATLGSHLAIHAAEGEFFRDAIERAAGLCQLRCEKIKEKQLLETAAAAFRIGDLAERLNRLAKSLGPPWREDEKYAAIAGWLALEA